MMILLEARKARERFGNTLKSSILAPDKNSCLPVAGDSVSLLPSMITCFQATHGP